MSQSWELKRNPFWSASSDHDSDTSSDVDNIIDTKDSSCISKRAPKKNPLQRIALSYASSDDDEDEFVRLRYMSTLPKPGMKTPCRINSSDDDDNDIEVGNDSIITITTPEDSSGEIDSVHDSEEFDNDDSDEDEKFGPTVTRSRACSMPELHNLTIRDKNCVLKISSESLVEIVDIVYESRESVSRCLAAVEDDYESQMVGDEAQDEVKAEKSKSFKPRSKLTTVAGTEILKRRKRKLKSKISPTLVRGCCAIDSVNLAVSDPWSMNMIKKCRIKVKKVHVQEQFSEETKQCPGRVSTSNLDGQTFISKFAQEIVQKIRGDFTLGETGEVVREKVEDSKVIKEAVSKVDNESSILPGSVTVEDSMPLVMKSSSLQSFSISSSGLGLDDYESDEDVVIIEETFVGPFPGSEFQSPSKIVSNSGNTHLVKKSDQKSSKIADKPGKSMKTEVETVRAVDVKKKNDFCGSPNKLYNTLKPLQSKERKKLSDLYKSKKLKEKALKDHSKQELKPKPSFGETLMSSLDFKIPKTKTKKEPGKVPSLEARKNQVVSLDGQNISMKKFLEQEDIVPDVSLESFTASSQDRQEFDSMYEDVNAIKNTTEKKNPEVNDVTELEDMGSVGWDVLKKMETDEERKSWVQVQFQNPICSDPATNLTFHGFRRLAGQAGQNQDLRSASFYISRGQLIPLAGVKRKERDAEKNEVDATIKLSDFGSFMKSVFFSKFNKKLGNRKASSSDFEAFKTYLGHYKGGQDETSNFLSYYNPKMELDLDQTKEVVDLENQFSTFSNYYGEAEDLFCKQCEKRHKFCQ